MVRSRAPAFQTGDQGSFPVEVRDFNSILGLGVSHLYFVMCFLWR